MTIPLEKLYKTAVEQGKVDDKGGHSSKYTARRGTSTKDALERCCAHSIMHSFRLASMRSRTHERTPS
jgi:hypothetical protein